MARPWTRQFAVALVLATVLLEAVAIVLAGGVRPIYDTVLYAGYAVVQACAGLLIVRRHPRHRIGWLLIGFALFNACADAASSWGRQASLAGSPAGAYAELAAITSWIVGALGLVLLFLLFPGGNPPDRRWWFVVWAWGGGALLAVPGWAMDPGTAPEFVTGVNPFAHQQLPTGLMFVAGAALVSGAVVSSVVALGIRFRRSRGVERQQLKWFVLAAWVAGIVLPASAALWMVVPGVRVLAAISLTLLPVSASVAILRHGLYDVDLVISRTVLYATMTAVLAAAYASVVLALGAAVGRGSAWASAAAALVVAVAFRPVRDRLQDTVDRRFRRARHESRRQMTEFVGSLRAGEVSPEQLEEALGVAVHDPDLALRFALSGTTELLDVDGRPATDDAGEGRARTPVFSGGHVQAFVVQDAAVANASLLADVVDAGGLAIEVAALQIELKRQLEALDASRARIVGVADEERRRIERDLHDGAQQRLVSIGLALRHAQHELGDSISAEADHALERAVTEVTFAIDDLRELASGLRPASLDSGLGPALRDLASRVPLPVTVEHSGERYQDDVETAVYFIACEGVTNAVKHAMARRIVLSVVQHDQAVEVSIDDDGVGGADPARGSGLTGLRDRVTARGGTLRIESEGGNGTRLVARLPCG